MFSASKTAAPVSGAYQISNSVRLRSAASAYFSRTLGSTSNRKTFTYSFWVKRGTIGSSTGQVLFGASDNVTSSGFIYFNTVSVGSTDCFAFQDQVTGTQLTTTQVFRDPSAWYHFVVSVDTTQATSIDRVKMYVNGTQITSFSTATYPSQNANTNFNYSSLLNTIGDYWTGYLYFFDGYLADINFIDGQALTPSAFGQINPTTGVWQPIKYAGTYGTNGFHLAFNNGTSTTTLGYDSSGNGNNWTTNNISLTAGSTYDWMIDSPTPYQGSSYGVGNYAVLNPIAGSATTYSNGNLNASGQSSVGTFWVATGKWYWEAVVTSGITGNTLSYSWAELGIYDGIAGNGFGYISNGEKENGGRSAFGATWTNGDTIGIALDADAKSLTFYKNGTSQGSFTFSSTSTVGYTPWMTPRAAANNYAYWFNFGQRPFAYMPPSGYKSLCTYNLPTPTIQNGANHFAATLYTGNGATQSIVNAVNGVSFQPNFVWVKSRSLVAGHELVDSVRGAAKTLYSNLTNAEDTTSQTVTAFNSNGFSVGADTGANSNGATQIAWQWKAGGTAVTNTAGSITSQVSANPTAGFSVVTYTGAISGTVGHGLGVAPSLIICKSRTAAVDWPVYHVSLGKDYALLLSTTNAAGMYSNYWGTSSPNASVFGLWSSLGSNNNGSMVAYCFAAIAGYSAFGSYTGNGSADGPFVWCGFRPRYVLVKATNSADNWFTWDTSRDPYNVASNDLYPNLSNAESGGPPRIDFLSNGFKCRASAANPNLNGATYIYACFAESPFQYSLAR